jgi:hypothetical protein
MALVEDDDVIQAFSADRTDETLCVRVLKGSQLHLMHMMGRSLSGSPMFFIRGTGMSSRCWTGAAPGERTAFISMMRRAD